MKKARRNWEARNETPALQHRVGILLVDQMTVDGDVLAASATCASRWESPKPIAISTMVTANIFAISLPPLAGTRPLCQNRRRV